MTVDPLAQLAEPPIFIVGVARSGTSWVSDIMGLHPLVTGIYETSLFDSRHGIAELLGDKQWGPDAAGLNRIMTREELAEEIRMFASRIFARRLGPEHQYVIEKTPGHLWMMPLIAEVFPQSRFIHVVRDGRDVLVSVRAARKSWARNWSNRGLRFSVARFAWSWKRAIRQAALDGSSIGDRYMEIRYEELKGDPFGSYRRLFDFCRIPHDEETLQQIHAGTDFDTVHVADEKAFFRGGRVGDWRTHLNLLDGAIFNLVAGDELVRLGYEPNRRWAAPLRKKKLSRGNRSRTEGSVSTEQRAKVP